MRVRIAPLGGEPGCAARWRLRSVVIMCGQGRVAWPLRASWVGLGLARAAVLRPQPAVSAARSTLATL
jgi:hypothetical protein